MSNKFIRNNELENQHILSINRLPARTTVIPAKTSGVFYKNKENSEFIQILNGDWDFSYQKNDCLRNFYSSAYDTSSWDKIDVPSMWQYRGYGVPSYPNVEYPIPFNPPYVCCENPVGYYKRTFFIETKTPKTILHFGGVDNAFYVYLNGEFIGFSKGSRIPAEFDVSNFIKEGYNSISVKVFTYSDATYLENQDMLLSSGIFRDVYLLHLPEVSLWDYRVTTTMNSFTICSKFNLGEAAKTKNYKISLSLDGQTAEFEAKDEIEHTFIIENPKLWNAEEPNLYDLIITVKKDNEIIEINSKRVGIMHTECSGRKFFVNGSPVYIKGVNRHEYDCENGRAISVSLIEKELRMIKGNNLNAIRCAHYNNNPAFYEIASEIGLYVMAEADIETHGASVTNDQGYLNKNPDWYDAFFDRVSRMLETCKNEPCIFIWSMGNECGEGENLNRCMEYTKKFDPTKALTYTQVKFEDRFCPPYSEFVSIGYASMQKLTEFEASEKPALLIEYAHAMGNSPGFLQGYQDYIYSHDHICGGFVWEFKNHGFKTPDGNILYGGDFSNGDKYHWYNFCLDGFLTSDGTPKPTWYELGEVMAPIYVTFDGKIKLYNTNDFISADYLTVKWEILEDYSVIRSGSQALPDIRPHETHILDIDLSINTPIGGATYYINLTFFDKDRQISKKQIELPQKAEKLPLEKNDFSANIIMQNANIEISGKNFSAKIEEGLLSEYAFNGNKLLCAPMQFNCYRATTDNDGIISPEKWFPNFFRRHAGDWKNAFLHSVKFHYTSVEYKIEKDAVIVTAKGRCVPDFEYLGFKTVIEYRIFNDGNMLIDIVCHPFGKLPTSLPRLGVVFEIKKDFDTCRWYGRGPLQNYSDAKANAHIGLYESTADKMNFMFDVPQDTGNREDASFVQLCSKDNGTFSVIGSDSFSFEFHDFAQNDLDRAMHKNELSKSEKNYLHVNYKTRGLGSRSCGPDPEPEFELFPHAFEFAFMINGEADTNEVLALARCDLGAKSQPLGEKYKFTGAEKQEEIADCKE